MRDMFQKFKAIFFTGLGVFLLGFGSWILFAVMHISADTASIKTAKMAMSAGYPFYIMGLGGALMLTPVLIQLFWFWINRNK